MGVAILTITKLAEGQEWANTWGIASGPATGPATTADIEAIISTNPPAGLTGVTTNPGDPSYAGATSIIAAILGFERLLHFPNVQFIRLNLSDSTTAGEPTGPFWSQAINFPGVNGIASPIPVGDVAPLSIALLVNRNTNLIGVRPGRLYYRAVLGDANVKPGSRVGVTWATPTVQTDISNNIVAASEDSSLTAYMSSPSAPLPEAFLCIPSTERNPAGEAIIVSAAAISSVSANKPVSRQLTRGRRRPVGA